MIGRNTAARVVAALNGKPVKWFHREAEEVSSRGAMA